jgi:hypothetical protein
MRVQLAVGVLILAAEAALACSCAPPPPPKTALAQSAAVFLAEVVSVEDGKGTSHNVTLKVEKWWKGGDAKTITVSTEKSGAACGYTFTKGGRYLVYAHNRDKEAGLRVSLCSRTRTAKQAEESQDFAELGEGKVPTKVSAAGGPVRPELKPGELLIEGAVLDQVVAGDRRVSVTLGPPRTDGATGGPARTRLVDLPVAEDAEVGVERRLGTRMGLSLGRPLGELEPGMTARLLLTVRNGRLVVTAITGQVESK